MIWGGADWTCECGWANIELRKRCRHCGKERPAVAGDVLSALGRLNMHARSRISYGAAAAIYAYKSAAALMLLSCGEASFRFVRWTGKCNRCTDGWFSHWDWDGYKVRCRDCGGTGRKTLRFTETTLPDGQVWHHPWFTGNGKGHELARVAVPGLAVNDEGKSVDAEGKPIEWHDAADWAPNAPGVRLETGELVPLLNLVEDWVENAPEHDHWLVRLAKQHARGHYVIDLGRAPGGCFVCGSTDNLAGFTYGRMTPTLHWSLPVCKAHGEGPEKAAHPDDPPPDALLTPAVKAWLARHDRKLEAQHA